MTPSKTAACTCRNNPPLLEGVNSFFERESFFFLLLLIAPTQSIYFIWLSECHPNCDLMASQELELLELKENNPRPKLTPVKLKNWGYVSAHNRNPKPNSNTNPNAIPKPNSNSDPNTSSKPIPKPNSNSDPNAIPNPIPNLQTQFVGTVQIGTPAQDMRVHILTVTL